MKKVIKETASAGSTGGGAIATVPHRLGDDMRRRESLKGFLLRFYKGVNNKMNMKEVKPHFTGIKEAYRLDEAYDLSDVVSQLKGLENSDVKNDNIVTYGVEDDNGNIMKISVKRDQAKDFEYRLATDMAEAKDVHMNGATAKISLAELLYDLKDEFNIVDVEFPKIPKDVIYNADKATKAPPGGVAPVDNDEMGDDMNPDQDLEGGEDNNQDFDENGAPLEGGNEGDQDLEQGESDFDEEGEGEESDDESVEDFGQEESTEGSPESILQQVMDMLKAQAEADTAKANAAAEESRAKQAEYSYKSAQATVAHETEFAQMEADADEQKQKQKDAKRLADLAKSKVQKASAFRESHSILGQIIAEMDDMDTEQSITRARNDLRLKWRPMPGDTPDTIGYKQQMLRDGNQELDTRLKAIKTRNMFNAQQKQKQSQLQTQQNNQNGNQIAPNASPNQPMNNGM